MIVSFGKGSEENILNGLEAITARFIELKKDWVRLYCIHVVNDYHSRYE